MDYIDLNVRCPRNTVKHNHSLTHRPRSQIFCLQVYVQLFDKHNSVSEHYSRQCLAVARPTATCADCLTLIKWNFQYHLTDCILSISPDNATPSNKPLSGSILAQIYVSIWFHWATVNLTHRYFAHILKSSTWYIYLRTCCCLSSFHDDVIRWKHFPRYWPFVREIHRSLVDSTHKGPSRGALMFSLISAWTKSCTNNREAGDLRRHRAHYVVTVMGITKQNPVIFILYAPVTTNHCYFSNGSVVIL